MLWSHKPYASCVLHAVSVKKQVFIISISLRRLDVKANHSFVEMTWELPRGMELVEVEV